MNQIQSDMSGWFTTYLSWWSWNHKTKIKPCWNAGTQIWWNIFCEISPDPAKTGPILKVVVVYFW